MPSPIRGTSFGSNFAATGRIRTELYIDDGNAEDNKRLFNELKEQRIEIEQGFGEQLSWEELPHRRASRIAAYSEGDVTLRDEWEKYIDWFFDTGGRIRRALAITRP